MRVRNTFLAVLSALALVAVAGAAAPPERAEAAAQRSEPAGAFDGDPATTERVDTGDPVEAAVRLSRARFPALAETAVLSRVDAFPDSLAGSALSDRGPLLFTDPAALTPATAAELQRVLPRGAVVYLLGGDGAVAPGVADDLAARGYTVRRLAGASRVETALAIADEVRRVRGDTGEVLVARAFGAGNETAAWADAVTAGAYAADRGSPLLITPTEAVHPAVSAWLGRDRPRASAVLGGSAAIADDVVRALPNASRYAGAERTATAAAVATGLWGADADGARRFLVVGGARPDGWAFGLAAAGAGADADAPVLMVTGPAAGTTRELLRSCGTPQVDLLVVGDGQAVADGVRRDLIALDGADCGAVDPPSRTGARRLAAYDGCAQLLGAFQQRALEAVTPYGFAGGQDDFGGGETGGMAQSDGEGSAAVPASGPATYSGTNIQEEGVDEPDVVKTDGEIAVAVAGGRVQVVDLAAQRLAATVDLPDGTFPRELLLESRTALIASSTYEHDAYDEAVGIYTPGVQRTALVRVDLTDPSAPRVTDTLEVDGGYVSARLVDGVARVVITSGTMPIPFAYGDGTAEGDRAALERNRAAVEATTLGAWLPQVTLSRAGEPVATEVPALGCDDVRAAGDETGLGLVSVLSIDLDSGVQPTSAAAVLAAGGLVYASPDRLYVATGQWLASPDGGGAATDLHAFDIAAPDATSYVGSGRLDGYLLNRYALSERDGLLRAAVTTQQPWTSPEQEVPDSQSSVVVMGEQGSELVEVGRVDGLGRGERIYAVRYFDDLAAVVTFRQVDPLYLVDLSDPTAPRVAGELKIPGFSEYLHRIDDDLLLAVGRDADEDGAVRGLQLSTFDIGDPSAPRLVDRLPFEGEYTSSSAEYDPRAFLWWPPSRRAVLPVDTYDQQSQRSEAVAVDVDEAGGLTEAGRVDHDGMLAESFCCVGLHRSFVAGADLWTLSELGMARDDFASLERRGTVPFPVPEGFDEPIPVEPGPAPASTEAPPGG